MADIALFADTILFVLSAYFGAGVVVAILFLAFGVSRIDAAATGASPFFRPMIFFGCVALWPYVILRFASLKKINLPAEEDQ